MPRDRRTQTPLPHHLPQDPCLTRRQHSRHHALLLLAHRSVPPRLVECIADLLKYDPSTRLTSLDCLEYLYILEANRLCSHVPPSLSVSTSLSGHSTGPSTPVSQFTSSPRVAQRPSSHLSSHFAGIFETSSSHRQSLIPAPDSSAPICDFSLPQTSLSTSTTTLDHRIFCFLVPKCRTVTHPSTAKDIRPRVHRSPVPPALPTTHRWLLADCVRPATHRFSSLPPWHTPPVPPPSTSTTPSAAKTAPRRPLYTRRRYQRRRNHQLPLTQRRPFSAPSSVEMFPAPADLRQVAAQHPQLGQISKPLSSALCSLYIPPPLPSQVHPPQNTNTLHLSWVRMTENSNSKMAKMMAMAKTCHN